MAMAAAMALSGAFFLPPLLLVVPAPLAALVYRRGYRAGMATGILLALGVFWLQSAAFSGAPGLLPADVLRLFQLAMLAWLLLVGLVGLAIGGSWREGGTGAAVILVGAGAFALPPLLGYAVAAIGWGVDLVDVLFSVWGRIQEEVVRQRELGGFPPQLLDQMLEFVQMAQASAQQLRPLLPGLLVTTAFTGSLASNVLARWMLRRRTPRPEPLPPFQLWRFPWYLAFGFLLGQGAMLLHAFGVAGEPVAWAGHNLHLFFSRVFLVQGLAVLYYYLTRRPMAGPLRIAFLLAAVFWLSPFVTWLGVLDVWFNFRRLPNAALEGDGNP